MIENSTEWLEAKQKEIDRKRLAELTMPYKVKILPNCIFRVSGPAVVGVEVMGGTCIPGVTLMNDDGKKLGSIKTIKDKDETLKELEIKGQAAVSMDDLVERNNLHYKKININDLINTKFQLERLSQPARHFSMFLL